MLELDDMSWREFRNLLRHLGPQSLLAMSIRSAEDKEGEEESAIVVDDPARAEKEVLNFFGL